MEVQIVDLGLSCGRGGRSIFGVSFTPGTVGAEGLTFEAAKTTARPLGTFGAWMTLDRHVTSCLIHTLRYPLPGLVGKVVRYGYLWWLMLFVLGR